MRRSTLVLIGLAAVAGLAGGLFYTWVVDPVEYYDTAPDALYAQDKAVYLAIIGDLYAYEQDLDQVKARLADLGVEADGTVLAGFIEQHLDGGGRPEEVRNLARLAEALGAHGGVLLVFGPDLVPSPTPMPPTPTTPPGIEASPYPTVGVTPTPKFRLVDRTALCAAAGQQGRVAIHVQDAKGNEMAGIEIVVSWAMGQDRLFTGLRPDLGLGYADFEMSPGTEYSVSLADFGGDAAEELSSALSAGVCPTGTVALDWQVTFQQEP
jgi:nucleotide-binding universal stress UspA family protein